MTVDAEVFRRDVRARVIALMVGGPRRASGVMAEGALRENSEERVEVARMARLIHDPMQGVTDPNLLQWLEWDREEPYHEPDAGEASDAQARALREAMILCSWQAAQGYGRHCSRIANVASSRLPVAHRTFRFGDAVGQLVFDLREQGAQNQGVRTRDVDDAFGAWDRLPDAAAFRCLYRVVRRLDWDGLVFDYASLAVDLSILHAGDREERQAVTREWMRQRTNRYRVAVREFNRQWAKDMKESEK